MITKLSEIDGKFYVYDFDEEKYQCRSLDGTLFANGEGDAAIKYVANRYDNKKSAQARLRKETSGE